MPELLPVESVRVALAPMLWHAGVGHEVISAMAAPVLGGLLVSDEVVDIFIPVRFYWVRRRRWLTLHGPAFNRKPEACASAVSSQELSRTPPACG